MSDRDDIVITGVGLASPVGTSAESTFAALLAGAAIGDHARVDDANGVASHWGDAAEQRLANLGHHVAIEALGRSGWSDSTLADARTALIVGTSKGPADDWLLPINDGLHPPTSDNQQCEDVTSTTTIANNWITRFNTSVAIAPARPIKSSRPVVEPGNLLGLHVICEALANRLGIGIGPRLTFSAACASSLHALIRAAMLLQHGDADRAIVVGAESSLHPAFIQSFKRLGVIANVGEPCRPMDRNRSGFLISEAAAAICLERRPARAGEIVLDGWAIGADASHLTHTNPDAATLRHCISTVLAARPVDLVHAHCTGTVANDVLELAAIEACLTGANALAAEAASPVEPNPGLPLEWPAERHECPVIYSHKGAIGHSLGASGLVATVINVMSQRAGVVPGNVNTIDPLPTPAGRIESRAVEGTVRRSIAIAAGFGGATGVVGLRTV